MHRRLGGNGKVSMTAGTFVQTGSGRLAVQFPRVKAAAVGAYTPVAPDCMLQIGTTGLFRGQHLFQFVNGHGPPPFIGRKPLTTKRHNMSQLRLLTYVWCIGPKKNHLIITELQYSSS